MHTVIMHSGDNQPPEIHENQSPADAVHLLLAKIAGTMKNDCGLVVLCDSTDNEISAILRKGAPRVLDLKIPPSCMSIEEAVEILNYYLKEVGGNCSLVSYAELPNINFLERAAAKIVDFVVDIMLNELKLKAYVLVMDQDVNQCP